MIKLENKIPGRGLGGLGHGPFLALHYHTDSALKMCIGVNHFNVR